LGAITLYVAKIKAPVIARLGLVAQAGTATAGERSRTRQIGMV
jgi:hypothetical protein